MRIHLHELASSPFNPITLQQFASAAQVAGSVGGWHRVSVGTTHAEFAHYADSIEALIAGPHTIRALDLTLAPNLRLIQATGAGVEMLAPFDQIPKQALLLNNRGVHADRAGEFSIMAMLMLATHLPRFVTDQRHRRWDRLPSSIVAGKRATIVGVGGLGGAAARRARQFGIHVTGVRYGEGDHPDCDETCRIEQFERLLPKTDFLLLACPLTEITRNLLDARRLALLPKRAGVINIGRGALMDQEALIAALRAGQLAGAVLDVFATEPIPADDPIWDAPNLIITPHISSDDPLRYNSATLAVFFENLRAIAAGRVPPTLVDRVKGY